jgi:hypothetical protein
MRIAVLIFGRLNKCVEHYKNLVGSLGQDNDIDFFLSSDNSSESLLNDFIHLYKPILYDNSPIHYDYDLGKYPGCIGCKNIHNMTCHFINKNRVFLLLEEYINKCNIHYDCVVSVRIDCFFYDKFVFDNLEDNTIYIPKDFDYGGLNDQLAYGKVDVMKKYNSINALDLAEKKLAFAHPETFTRANVFFHNLKVERFDMKYAIIR